MSEKSAEEKLRQALEGSITGDNGRRDSGKNNPKPRPRIKSPSPRTGKPDNISQRVDSFMDDFERMVEQSLSAVKSPAGSKQNPAKHAKKPTPTADPEPIAPIIPIEPEPVPTVQEIPIEPEQEPSEQEIPFEPEPESTAQKISVEPEQEPIAQEIPAEPEKESAPQEIPIEPEQEQEIIPEVMPMSDAETELPDIPVIEADFSPVPENSHEDFDAELPDIPIIEADDDSTQDDEESIIEAVNEEFSPPEDDEAPADDEQPQYELQEAELHEAPDIEDDFDDVSDDYAEAFTETDADFPEDFRDEPIDEEPVPYVADEDFSPTADVVVSVDDDLPQISAQEDEQPDPEAEPAPVSVTMPESTKTAEDKLMADIAEAMTGNPLTLDAQEQPGDFAIPENFFTDETSGDSPQSAEDKLKANIAQAISESPIDTAQNQARQDLEQDINPFDELTDFDSLLQQGIVQEDEPQEEENIFEGDFPQETQDNEAPQDSETDDDPFAGFDFSDGEPEAEPEQEPEPEQDPEPFPEIEPESEPFPEIEQEPEQEADEIPEADDDIPFTADETEPEIETETSGDMPFTIDDAEPENVPVPKLEPVTEQSRLEQEIAAMTQQAEPEIYTAQEEAQQDNDMPEQSLLDDNTQENLSTDDDNDSWDMSSLGVLSEAASIPDDEENENFSSVPETVTEMITPNLDDEHKEKTMSIREKLALRKDGASDNPPAAGKKKSSSGGGGGGILLPLMLGIIAVIGGLMLWQIMTLSDKISSLAMSSPSFESVPGIEANPSYDYAIDFILDPNLSDRMSQRGREGWQVVGSRRTQDSTTGQYGYELIFMRRTPGR